LPCHAAGGHAGNPRVSEIRKLIVAGTGPLTWIAAAGLLRAFRHRGLDVFVLDAGPARDARVGRWTLPSQRGMHALLGIAEPHLVQQTGATFKLATEHIGWQPEDSRFLHAHGEIGVELSGVPFYKLLQREALAGRPKRPELFCVAAAAAKLGKFARPMGDRNALTSSFTYGFHLEDAAYTQYLRAHAMRLGVREFAAALTEVVRDETGNIRDLRLADGTAVSADFYVDCTGADARLLGPSSERDDWSAWLPCDRMWSAFGPPMNDPPPVTQTMAATSGWLWRAPLSHAGIYGYVYSSRFQDDASARAVLNGVLPTSRGSILSTFSPGRRQKFWERNCVALGSAAVEIEPLAGGELHLAQIGLATLIELFPLTSGSGIEAAEYNRVMGEHADALRDFTIAHYRGAPARGGEFWLAARDTAAPARLADKLDLYAASGRINLLDHETFEEVDWAWLLMGSGCKTAALELQVRDQLEKIPPQQVEMLRTHVAQLAASMPRHIDFVRHQATPAPRAAG
jgi:tryptophan halogenase